jgi:hypothetical protein
MAQEKAYCKNLLCKMKPYTIQIADGIDIRNKLATIKCKHCNYIGMMLDKETLTKAEVVEQVKRWGDVVLYKKAFKAINYKKLPNSMNKQKITTRTIQKKTAPIKPIRRDSQ